MGAHHIPKTPVSKEKKRYGRQYFSRLVLISYRVKVVIFDFRTTCSRMIFDFDLTVAFPRKCDSLACMKRFAAIVQMMTSLKQRRTELNVCKSSYMDHHYKTISTTLEAFALIQGPYC